MLMDRDSDTRILRVLLNGIHLVSRGRFNHPEDTRMAKRFIQDAYALGNSIDPGAMLLASKIPYPQPGLTMAQARVVLSKWEEQISGR